MKTMSSPRIIDTNERVVIKRITKCPSCKYEYEEMDVYVIPRLRKVVSKVKNGKELASKEILQYAKDFYETNGFLDEYYMRYVKLTGKYTKGEPIYEKTQRLYGSKKKFQKIKIKNEETKENELYCKCPECGTMVEFDKAFSSTEVRQNAYDISSSESTHVMIDTPYKTPKKISYKKTKYGMDNKS